MKDFSHFLSLLIRHQEDIKALPFSSLSLYLFSLEKKMLNDNAALCYMRVMLDDGKKEDVIGSNHTRAHQKAAAPAAAPLTSRPHPRPDTVQW